MQSLRYETVIVGSGFAGRTVASYCAPDSFVIIERGEDRGHGETLRRYLSAPQQLSHGIERQKVVYRSDLPWNSPPILSRWNYSQYAMIRGGSSNWWGGKSTRFSPDVFSSRHQLSWAITSEEMSRWYEKAEDRLNISGDPGNALAPPKTAMPGFEYWNKAFEPYFREGHLYNTALNKREQSMTSQGLCKGRGDCAVCPEDAKARPDNIFPDHPTLYETLALNVSFDGDRATGLECFDGKQLFTVEFNTLVVACNGIETPRLLGRSMLPSGVPVEFVGAFLQDHAHVEISCKIDKKLMYGNLGGLAHVEIGEISGMYSTAIGDIEVSALAITHEPRPITFKAAMNIDLLRQNGIASFVDDLNGCFDIFCELEIPPQAGIRVDLHSDEPSVLDASYESLIPIFDGVVREMVSRLAKLGVSVLDVNHIYRTGYGGHHFCGTTNCSAGSESVVDPNMRLIGTSNVFIAGASVIPRAGGVAPTLTLIALAERLGSYLQDQRLA